MNNNGQITLFFILGFVILIGFGLVYYVSGNLSSDLETEVSKTSKIAFSVDNVKNFLELCFKDLTNEGIDYISERGGYFTLSKYSYEYGEVRTAYYFYEDRNLPPTLEVLENSISMYVKSYVNYCFDDLSDSVEIPNVEYKIENVSTKLVKDNIILSLLIPTKIKSNNLTYEINNYQINLEGNRLHDIYNFNNYLIEEQIKDKYSLCLSCIISKGDEYNFFIDIDNVGNSTLIFKINYNDTKINEFKRFIFANKYKQFSCSNPPLDTDEYFLSSFIEDCTRQKIEEYNYSFNVEDMGNLYAYVGVPFITKIKATGANLTFKDYTDLFEIESNTGIISFVPNEEQVGEHLTLIEVKDGFENIQVISINLTILNP
ncbi:hypothetical protein HYX02_02550 [Candidatus Woesearchaeota archaeon]|nr:hypothetical protein [Candidatus Woesearchaeota archaeon]